MATIEELKHVRRVCSDRSDRAGVAKCDEEIAEAEKLAANTKAVKVAAKKLAPPPAKKAPAKKAAAKKKKGKK